MHSDFDTTTFFPHSKITALDSEWLKIVEIYHIQPATASRELVVEQRWFIFLFNWNNHFSQ